MGTTLKNDASFGGNLDLFEIVALASMRWKLAAIVAATMGLLIFSYTYFLVAPYYTSRGVILVPLKDSPGGSMGGLSQAIAQFRGGSSSDELAQFEVLLKTERVTERIKERLGVKEIRAKWRTSGPTMIIESTQTDPVMAQKVVSELINELEASLVEISTKKAQANREFFEARLKEAEVAMVALERRLNDLRLSQGQREYSIQSKILSLLREQLEISQIEAKKEQKSFVVIDPPIVPADRSGPQRLKSAVTGTLATFLALLLGLIVWDLVQRERQVRRTYSRGVGAKDRGGSGAWAN